MCERTFIAAREKTGMSRQTAKENFKKMVANKQLTSEEKDHYQTHIYPWMVEAFWLTISYRHPLVARNCVTDQFSLDKEMFHLFVQRHYLLINRDVDNETAKEWNNYARKMTASGKTAASAPVART